MQPAGTSTFLENHDQSCPLVSSFCARHHLADLQGKLGMRGRSSRMALLLLGLTHSMLCACGPVVALRTLLGGFWSSNIHQIVNYSHKLPTGLLASSCTVLESIFHTLARVNCKTWVGWCYASAEQILQCLPRTEGKKIKPRSSIWSTLLPWHHHLPRSHSASLCQHYWPPIS